MVQTLMPSLAVLVDYNSFFASCEKVFRPDLDGQPGAVLSIRWFFILYLGRAKNAMP
jgi:hypothetical protein